MAALGTTTVPSVLFPDILCFLHSLLSRIMFSGLFQFRIDFWNYDFIRHFGRTACTEYRPIETPLSTQDSTTQKIADMPMPRAGFDPSIPVFEGCKTYS